MFNGFSEKTTEFLWGIRLNNSRAWFTEHKQDYLENVLSPLKALADDVWSCVTEKTKLDLMCHVTRIYRDARRVRSGGLYKDSLWFSLEKTRDGEWTAMPGFFFEISPEGYAYGMGLYMAPPATMKNFRDCLDANPAEFERIAAALKKRFMVYGDEYARPKGVKEGVIARWYNRKTLGVIAKFMGHDKLYSPKFAKTLCADFLSLVPLYRYFMSLEGTS